MRQTGPFVRLLFFACLIGCGDAADTPGTPDAPAAPAPDAPEASVEIAPLVPANAYLHLEVASIAAAERDFGGVFSILVGRTPRALFAAGVPHDRFDPERPAAFVLAGADGTARIVPVREGADVEARLTKGGYAVRTEDAQYAPHAEPPAVVRGLPAGALRGRVLIGKAPVPAEALAPVTDLLGPFDAATWTLRRDGDALHAHVSLAGAPPKGAARAADALARLPRAATLVFASGFDQTATWDLLARAERAVHDSTERAAALRHLAPGLALSFETGAKGPRAVLVARTLDPTGFLREHRKFAEKLAQQVDLTLKDGPRTNVEGVEVHTRYAVPPKFDPARYRRDAGKSYVFRVANKPTGEAWMKHDEREIEARLESLGSDGFGHAIIDDEYLCIVVKRSVALRGVEVKDTDIRALAAAGRTVRLRRVVRPQHPSYAAYRARLKAGHPKTIAPADRTAADKAAGSFPHGLRWCTLHEALKPRMPESWRPDDHFLVALDGIDFSPDDIEWAFVTTARYPPQQGVRDVSFRVKKNSLGRLKQLAQGEASPPAVLVVDGQVVADTALEPAGAGDFHDFAAAHAERIAIALARPPLQASYAFDGIQHAAFGAVRRERRRFHGLFGEQGLPVHAGVVDGWAFVVVGNDADLLKETIARLKAPDAAQPAALAALRERVGEGHLCAQLSFFKTLLDDYEYELAREGGERQPILENLPSNLAPDLLDVAHDGEVWHLRARLDRRRVAYLAKQHSEQRLRGARVQVRLVRSGKDDVPKTDPWGTKLRVEDERVTSAGPDATFDTDDDIVAD